MDYDADLALERLAEIIKEFILFVESKGKASEADTRVKFIDRIIKEVCMWPESEISRENHVESGYTDYQIKVRNTPLVVVEAKREGMSFELPKGLASRSPKLNGAILTVPDVKNAINQVRQYCDDQGIKFAIATNGYTWIIFRAIRDDMPWKEGRARVFPSISYIEEHFVEFWNLLSYQGICEGSLDSEFGRITIASRKLLRVIDKLFNADLPLRRNRLNTQLQPLVKYIFEDIAAQDDLDLLRSCYVHTESLRIVAKDLKIVIDDAIPEILAAEGGKPLIQSDENAGEFGDAVEKAVREKKGELYLLLGGIGSGKTTFLKRYEKVLAKDLLEEKTYCFHLDFLQAPLDKQELEIYVWKAILDIIRSNYDSEQIEEREYLKTIFKEKLKNLERTVLHGLRRNKEAYDKVINRYLLEWQDTIEEYVPKLLRYASVMKKKTTVLIIDNVDQLDPDYQAQIFLLSQRVTRLAGCITVIALREESYYTPSIQNTFTAYTSHKFHIASPQFRKMIGNRIEYAIQGLEEKNAAPIGTVFRGITFETQDICDFLRIVQFSLLEWSWRISRFIECICFGNMRSALQMFTTFLTSGATDVDKMLLIYRRDGAYNVAFHEFLKSVMLQDRAYYKEEQSPLFNIFNCTSEKNASHFTSLRLLALLLEARSESNPEGRGYVELSRVVGFFGESFDNIRDLSATLDRLVNRQLIEVNTRSTKTVTGASHIRVTAAGWYYLTHLSRTFAYLDLVLQDTPLNDENLEHYLRQSVYDVNNLSDREREKFERMQVRFNRTQSFLDYLNEEEEREFGIFEMSRLPKPLSERFMPLIQERFKIDREYIERRLTEGRSDDLPVQPDDFSAAQFDMITEDLEPEES
jgi:hypothetical protein